MRAITVCPLCRGDLATNVHPLEKRVASLMNISLAIGLGLFIWSPGPVTGGLMGAELIVCLVAAGYLHAKTKNWQRYRRYASEP